jgi:hypothetical protein
MRLKISVLIAAVFAFTALPRSADAQLDKPWKDWYGHVAGGWVGVQGDAGDVLEDGWTISGGATFKPGEWPLGIVIEGGYSGFDMTRSALDYFESSGGDADVWSLTTGAVWATKTSGSIGFSLKAAVGGYYVSAQLKEPAYVCGPICDPYFPWYCWWGCTPGSVITDKRSATEFGYEIAAAVHYKLGSDSTVYLEAKYQWIDTRVSSKFMPVVIGFQW